MIEEEFDFTVQSSKAHILKEFKSKCKNSGPSLEMMTLSYLDKIFDKVSIEQQQKLGIDERFCTEFLYLVPQDLAGDLLSCFIGERRETKARFAIFGRLLLGNLSIHVFAVQTDHNHICSVEMKIPSSLEEKMPDYLFFENMPRWKLCSNKYYLYILAPKAPPPINLHKSSVDIFLLSAIPMGICEKQKATFQTETSFRNMIKYNTSTLKTPEFFYTKEECKHLVKVFARCNGGSKGVVLINGGIYLG